MATITNGVMAVPSVASAQARGSPIGFELWGNLGAAIGPVLGVGVRGGLALRVAGFTSFGAEMLVDVGTRNSRLGLRFGGGPVATIQFGSLAGWSYFEPMLSLGVHVTTDDDKTWIDPFARGTLALAVNSFRIGLAATAGPHVPLVTVTPTATGLCLDVALTVQRYF